MDLLLVGFLVSMVFALVGMIYDHRRIMKTQDAMNAEMSKLIDESLTGGKK